MRLVIGGAIKEPAFAARLRTAGLPFTEFALADAITLDSVVVANGPLSRSTLFHELVHVAQCRILGVDLFGERYLLEYVAHGYDSMPLERLAVDLAHRYETGEEFSVEESLLDAL